MPTTYAIPNGRTVFDATTYTGDGSQTASFTNQFNFKPDLVWSRIRTGTTQDIGVFDSVRGTTGQSLDTASTSVEGTWNGALSSEYGYVSAFNSNGFSVNDGSVATTGGYVNYSGRTYVAWQWQAGQGTTSSNTNGSITSTVSSNTTAGFSIVTYTGNLSSAGTATVGHGLGAAPKFMITKSRNTGSAGYNWGVFHTSVSSTFGKVLYLNTSGTGYTFDSGNGIPPAPTSTTFGTCWQETLGINSSTYVAYCWAQVPGFSDFSYYTGNGSNDGPFVYTNFRPKFVMIKRTDSAADWYIFDTSRSPYNYAYQWLRADTNDTENTNSTVNTWEIDILSNGFKIRNNGAFVNASNGNYIYAAFAENPFKYANAR